MKKNIAKLIRSQIKFFRLEKLASRFTRNSIHGEKAISRLLPDHYKYTQEKRSLVKRNNINYEVCIGEHIDWYIFYGFIDPSKSNLYSAIKSGDTVLDIGSNVGEVLMNISKIVGNKGMVHGFEPDFENYKRLSKNLSLNEFENIKVNNIGLSYENGFGTSEINNIRNKGMNSISQVMEDDKNEHSFEILTLDNYINKTNISSLDFIKIDVEGYEFNVLKGAESALKKYKPTLFIELDDNNLKKTNHTASELVSLLEDYNYSIKNVNTNTVVSSENNFENCHFDIICIHSES